MSIIDKAKKLSTPLFVLYFGGNLVVGIGIGVLLAGLLTGFGWAFLILGILMHVPGLIKMAAE